MTQLELDVVTAGYHSPQPVIQQVSLKVQSGSILALMGPNGAGKTTTLAAISGLIRLQGGTIKIDGERIDTFGPAGILRAGIAHVPEGRRILPGLTVHENLMMGAFTVKSARVVADRLERLLTLFPVLHTKRKLLGGKLSGGEQEMLAIARALMSNPRILLLDEPSMGLAPLVVQKIFEYLVQLRDGGLGILLVEQNATMALRVADDACILERGRIIRTAPPDVLIQDESVRKAYLGA